MRNHLFLVEEMSQGLNLVCQPPLTIAVTTIPSIQQRYALAPTVRAQLMAGNSSSWDVADNHTNLPKGINLQAPQLPVRPVSNPICIPTLLVLNASRVPAVKKLNP